MAKKNEQNEKQINFDDQNIVPIQIEDEMKTSYLNYAMSVIVGRALPDVRDGLKPVHRRILYAMKDLGLDHSRSYKKCARIVGEVLGKYHPHGDTAVYDALVRLAQDFSLRYPLIDGQGNFGSVDGDSAAAMRYCVTGDTLVVSDKGLIPIQELSESKSEDIDISILSKDKKINKASKWFDSGIHPTLEIYTSRGYSLKGSYNHPVLTWNANGFQSKPEVKWKLFGQLAMGDYVVMDRTSNLLWPEKELDTKQYQWVEISNRAEVKELPTKLSEDLAFILGALVAEGSIAKQKIEFCNSDASWIEDFKARWKNVFPDTRLHSFLKQPSSYGKKAYQRLEVHSQHAIRFLESIGLLTVNAAEKVIPHTILKSPRNVVATFLRTYFEGDGCIARSGKKMVELSCCSASEELIHQLQVLLLRFSIVSTRRYDKFRSIHKLYIRGAENYRLFKKEIGFVSVRKNSLLEEVVDSCHKVCSATDFVPFLSQYVRSHLNQGSENYRDREFASKNNFDRYNNLEEKLPRVATAVAEKERTEALTLMQDLIYTHYLLDPIVRIEEGVKKRVYSVRVDSDCHSFVANGFINHNTEARLASVSSSLLTDLEKDTVDFANNFDETLQEPKLLPAVLPNLLVNGSGGIAVGMATNIPPHNLREVSNAIFHLLDNPKGEIKDLTKFVKGPDFPTGAQIIGGKGIQDAYNTGRGSIVVRGRVDMEELKGGREAIVITEIPYQVNKTNLIENIANLVNSKKIEGISDIRDESDRKGMRIVIILKRDSASQVILNQLYKHTQLQTSMGIIMLAIVEGRPRTLTLKEILENYIRHRKEIIIRRARYELEKARDRAHILEGLLVAVANIDKIIKLIRASKSPEVAKEGLINEFDLSERQAKAILELQLQRLTALERHKIDEEYAAILKRIKELEHILKSEKKVIEIIREELQVVVEKFGDARRTEIKRDASSLEMDIEDLVADEDMAVTISAAGYVKRSPLTTYRKQKRGGVGVTNAKHEEDFIEHLFVASTHDHLLLFTTKGKVYKTRVHELPQAARTTKGKFVKNFVPLNQGEDITSIVPIRTFEPNKYLVMMTQQGVVKRCQLDVFDNIRKNGIAAVNLHKDDELISVRLTDGTGNIFAASNLGKAIHFPEKQVRSMGRSAAGVRGFNLGPKDYVVGMEAVEKDDYLLTVTEKGFAKRTKAKEYRLQSRGGKGITNIKVTDRNGKAIGMKAVSDNDELMVMSTKGMIVRVGVKDLRATGRAAQGVKVINLKSADKVATMTCIEAEEALADLA